MSSLISRLSRYSFRDPLTGLLNERGLCLQAGLSLAGVAPERCSVLLIVDVDDFDRSTGSRGAHAATPS